MTGPSLEETLTWMLAHADRNPSAEVVITVGGETKRYRARIWKDGTIAFRPTSP